jgi:dihydrofolate reductase
MRKIILELAITLDGFIEGPKGEYDWCFTDQDYGMSDFMKRIDAIFYGRKSYEMMMKVGETEQGNPWKGIKSYVFSNTWKNNGNNFKLVSGDIVSEVRGIKDQSGKDIWLFGGASLTTSLLNANLIDEIRLSVHPILLGQGKLLFSGIESRIKTKLLTSKAYETGLVSLHYTIENRF